MPEQETCRVVIGKSGLYGYARGTNLIGPIRDAVRSYYSLREICNVLRNVFGKYRAH